MTPPTSHLVGPLLRWARERGELLDPEPFGLDARAFERDESAIADAQLAARASATLREALQQWTRYAALLHPAVVFELEESTDRVSFHHRTLGHPRGLSRHLNEFALAANVYFGRETSAGAGPRVLEALFVHARPRSLERLREFFQTRELTFGAPANTLVLEARSLDVPQRTADPRLLATVESASSRRSCRWRRSRRGSAFPSSVASAARSSAGRVNRQAPIAPWPDLTHDTVAI